LDKQITSQVSVSSLDSQINNLKNYNNPGFMQASQDSDEAKPEDYENSILSDIMPHNKFFKNFASEH
jgi:hypothetical protein